MSLLLLFGNGADGRAVGQAAGTSDAAAIGQSRSRSVGAATGTGAATGIGRSKARAVAAAAGTALVLGVAVSNVYAVGAATGTGTATAVGRGERRSIGTSSWISDVNASGRSVARSIGAATGTGTATGVGRARSRAVGSATGTGTALGVGRANVRSVASASGTSTAPGVGQAVPAVWGNIGIVVNGIDRTSRFRRFTTPASMQTELNELPDSFAGCFQITGSFTPQVADEIKVYRETAASTPIFGGHIVDASYISEESKLNQAANVRIQDYSWAFNKLPVNGRYISQSATAIVTALLPSGFTGTNIVAGLPTIDDIEFIDEPRLAAIVRVMKRVGGYAYIDTLKDVHAFLTEASDAPDTINDANVAFRNFVYRKDLSQLRNKILVEGGGSQVTVAVPAGNTTIPLEDASWYNAGGGMVKIGSQRVTYTGLVAGDTGSVIASAGGPGSAPSAALGSGAGGVLGVVSYKVSFKNTNGETVPGPASGNVTGVAFTAPGGGPAVALASGLGRIIGTNLSYRVTFVTDVGETLSGPASSAISPLVFAPPASGGPSPSAAAGLGRIVATNLSYKTTYVTEQGETLASSASGTISPAVVAAPTAPSAAATGSLGPLVGAFGYKVTYVTQYGETTASTAGSRTATAVAAPGAPTVNAVSSPIGYLIGAYSYKVTFVNVYGETLGGTVGSRTAVALTGPSAPSIGTHLVGGPLVGGFKYKISFVSAIGESLGTATSTTTAALTQPNNPSVTGDGTGQDIAYAITFVHPEYGESELSTRTVDTDKATNPVVAISGSPSLPSTCGWNIYSTGTVAAGTGGTAPLFLIKSKATGDSSSFTHTSETGPGEGVRPSLGKSIPLSSIATGPSGTVARRIYRTQAGGSTYFLVAEIGDNSTTSYTDSTPDSALTVPEPIANLNGQQHALTSVATGGSGTTARRIYRTVAGGSEYKLLGEIPNNSTTTFTDNVADEALGAVLAPLVSTAGGEGHTVTFPTGASGTLARRIYRTVAGGSVYYLLAEVADNTTTTFADTKKDSELGADNPPLVNTAGGQNVTLGNITTGPSGTLARRIYRTQSGGSIYYFLAEVGDNVTTTFTDTKLDSELGAATAPLVNLAGGQNVSISSIATGAAGTLARRIYRTKSGGSEYFYVGQLSDNSTTTFTDSLLDSELGKAPPLVNEAGASTVNLTSIPLGGAGITARRIYRTYNGGSAYYFVAEIRDNTTTTYTDSYEDDNLGDIALDVGTIGALVGDTTLLVDSGTPFISAGGWARTGSQVIRYTGKTGTTLTGIPASGDGSIQANIPASTPIINEPHLTGIPASSTGSLARALVKGDAVSLIATAEDAASQALYDVIESTSLKDSTLTYASALDAATAYLALYKDPLTEVTLETTDPKAAVGKTLTVSLSVPLFSGTFKIQSVSIAALSQHGHADDPDWRSVKASTVVDSFEAIVRRLQNVTLPINI